MEKSSFVTALKRLLRVREAAYSWCWRCYAR